ncbi:MAG TPA: hypothetical protein VFW66_08865 [Gemmatimonadales bacterium]|nr:hypothetical protein [Gemmatimonadales bacterium]
MAAGPEVEACSAEIPGAAARRRYSSAGRGRVSDLIVLVFGVAVLAVFLQMVRQGVGGVFARVADVLGLATTLVGR